jgi:hypothetical protein
MRTLDPDLMVADEVLVWVFVPEYDSDQMGWKDAVRVAKEREAAEEAGMRKSAETQLQMESAVRICREALGMVGDEFCYSTSPVPEWHSSKFPHS